MWRPENWDGQWVELPSAYPPNEGWARLMHKGEQEIFEAGADAALKVVIAELKPLMAEAIDISDWSFVQQFVRNLE